MRKFALACAAIVAAVSFDLNAHTYVNGCCDEEGCDAPYEVPEQIAGVYQIANGGNLFWFATNVNASAKAGCNAVVTADIDLENRAFPMIGADDTNAYNGTFDGQGHTISGLSVTTSATRAGFFGAVAGGTIKNFRVQGAIVSQNTDSKAAKVGTIGYDSQAKGTLTIQDVRSSVTITTCDNNGHVGGIIGSYYTSNKGDVVERCWFDGTIYKSGGIDCLGGVVGYTSAGQTIRNCLYSGSLTQTDSTSSTGSAGGILSYNSHNNFGGIKNCLSMGTISVTTTYIGAIAGRGRNGNGNLNANTNNYYTATAAANATTATTKYDGKGTAWSNVPTEYADDDAAIYDGTLRNALGKLDWQQDSFTAGSFPHPSPHTHVYDQNGFCIYDGCADPYEQPEVVDDVYQLKNAANLFVFASLVNTGGKTEMNAAVTKDIDLGSRDFPMIGADKSNSFVGTFDGQGHAIKNLSVTSAGTFVGFFGDVIDGSTIKNFSLTGSITSTVQSAVQVGTIGHITAASNSPVLIENIHSSVSILGADTRTSGNQAKFGGIIGGTDGANLVLTIDRCWFDGTIDANDTIVDCAAGIVGYTLNVSLITNCLYSGTISGTASGGNVGGILAWINNAGFKGIYSCVSMGSICAGGSYVGAITGGYKDKAGGGNTPNGKYGNNFYTAAAIANSTQTDYPYDGFDANAWDPEPTRYADDAAEIYDGTLLAALGEAWHQSSFTAGSFPIPTTAATIAKHGLVILYR